MLSRLHVFECLPLALDRLGVRSRVVEHDAVEVGDPAHVTVQGRAQACEEQSCLGPCLLVRGWSPRVVYKASMFSRQPRAERSRAASLPLTRLERTEPQMKRSSRATPGVRGWRPGNVAGLQVQRPSRAPQRWAGGRSVRREVQTSSSRGWPVRCVRCVAAPEAPGLRSWASRRAPRAFGAGGRAAGSLWSPGGGATLLDGACEADLVLGEHGGEEVAVADLQGQGCG